MAARNRAIEEADAARGTIEDVAAEAVAAAHRRAREAAERDNPDWASRQAASQAAADWYRQQHPTAGRTETEIREAAKTEVARADWVARQSEKQPDRTVEDFGNRL